MNTVKIIRAKEYNNRGKKIKLYIDNVYYNNLGLNEELKLSTNSETIKIKAKIDWCTSKNYQINFSENPNPKIEIYSSISNKLFLFTIFGSILCFTLTVYLSSKITMILLLLIVLVPLYKITLDYKNYLKFKMINSK